MVGGSGTIEDKTDNSRKRIPPKDPVNGKEERSIDQSEKLMGRKNGNTEERMQHQEVLITGENRIGDTIHCDLQESVILRIPAGRNHTGDFNPNRDPRKQTEELLTISGIEVFVEFRSAKDLHQFGKCRIRNQDFTGFNGLPHRPAG